MDRLIVHHHSTELAGGLRWCDSLGLAFQDDMSRTVVYGDDYFDRHVAYEGTPINQAITAARIEMVRSSNGLIFDIGSGSGTFLAACQESGLKVLGGFDINPKSQQWLTERGWLFSPYHGPLPSSPIAWTLWDVLEHLRSPHELLDRIRVGDELFLTVPIYRDLKREVLASKHFRPDEHFYYFTPHGLIRWLAFYGFELLGMNRHEQTAGRKGVASFVFKKPTS